jgi:hypothetical protein
MQNHFRILNGESNREGIPNGNGMVRVMIRTGIAQVQKLQPLKMGIVAIVPGEKQPKWKRVV